MTVAAVCLTGLVQVVQNQSWGHQVVQDLGAVKAIVEVALKENLAGNEHLAAIAAVLVLCAVAAVRQRRSRARAGSPSGAPPIQS